MRAISTRIMIAVLGILACELCSDERCPQFVAANKCLAQEVGGQKPSPAAPDKAPIRMKLDLVAGRDGGKLRAGEVGWVRFSIYNVSGLRVLIPMALMSAKAADDRPRPSKWDDSFYSGFGVASLQYAFTRAGDNRPLQWTIIPPPDDPLEIDAGEAKRIWRLVTAPKEPGVYELHLKLNNAKAVEAVRSYNNPPIIQPTEALTVESHADGVEIVAGRQ